MDMWVSREIARPADEVFDFFADASNNPRWQDGMISCEWVSEPPIAVGSVYEQRARFMGREIVSTFVVKDYQSGRMIEIETIESTFPIHVIRSVEPIDGSNCRVTAHISGGPEGRLARLLEPLMAKRAQKSVDSDYDRLVGLLESR